MCFLCHRAVKVAKVKIKQKFKISFSWESIAGEVLFEWSIGFCPQTQKLEPPYKRPSLTLGLKGPSTRTCLFVTATPRDWCRCWIYVKCSAVGIGFNGAETNCGIVKLHAFWASSWWTVATRRYIFFSNYYNLQSVHFEYIITACWINGKDYMLISPSKRFCNRVRISRYPAGSDQERNDLWKGKNISW